MLGDTVLEKSLSKQVEEDGNNFAKSTSGKNITKSTIAISVMSNFNLKPSIKLRRSNFFTGIMAGKNLRQKISSQSKLVN